MKLSEFDYYLPRELIAQEPVKPRDHSRLLILDKANGQTEDRHFNDLVDYLKPGDVLVMNNSKVFPARLIGQRAETGGKLEVFLLRDLSSKPFLGKEREAEWQCLVGGKRARIGLELKFGEKLAGKLIKNNNDSTWVVEFNYSGKKLMKMIEELGQTPLPPYIKPSFTKASADKENYQTVYADDDKAGSVAAPTAGFHFTLQLIEKIKAKGVQIEYVTLHVGLGTFAPVKTEDIVKHKMHSEYVEIDSKTVARLQKVIDKKRRIIAVGTTSARSLEAMAGEIGNWKLEIGNLSKWVEIFIYPGYRFKIIDGLITNFHLPKSTLLMLASAFAGKENIDKAYRYAIKSRYRFYSYGDAMFIK